MTTATMEHDIAAIAYMDKSELKHHIRHFHGRFELDFTDSYLDDATEDHLRHILFAALVNAQRHP